MPCSKGVRLEPGGPPPGVLRRVYRATQLAVLYSLSRFFRYSITLTLELIT